MKFADRFDAGRRLAATLAEIDLSDPVVLALPRGGVPVGFEVAQALDAPLDVVVVRKVGAPFQPELGVGAIAEGGDPMLNEEMLSRLGLTREDLADTIARERAELERRLRHYRGDRPPPMVKDRGVVLVDDGLATGGTARAALHALRQQAPNRLVLAVPVGAPHRVETLHGDADDVVCLSTPHNFVAIGQWYEDFEQTSDDTVLDLLRRTRRATPVQP